MNMQYAVICYNCGVEEGHRVFDTAWDAMKFIEEVSEEYSLYEVYLERIGDNYVQTYALDTE